MAIRWEVTVQSSAEDLLTGPLTLTNAGQSVTVAARGVTAGNDNSGYSVHLQLTSNTGDNAAFPDCRVLANSQSSQGDPFPRPYTSMTISALDISYSGCRGFIEYPSPLQNHLQETARLTLTKQ